MRKVLIIEDDEEIVFLLQQFLKRQNYEVISAFNGLDAISTFEHSQSTSKPFDAILLDLMLPDLEGEKILTHIRKSSQIPIIIISAKSELDSKLINIRNGADDYITKPFHFEEVLVRLEAVLRRSGGKTSTGNTYTFKDIELNDTQKTVHVSDFLITLTPKEYELLKLMISSPNMVHTKEMIMENLWCDSFIDENAINVHISNLRKKLDSVGQYSPYILTVWGIGYKMSGNR